MTHPYMSAWPRGSHISAFLRGSRFSWKNRFFSRIVSPGISGKPPVTMRSGSPAACASSVVSLSQPDGGCQAEFTGRVILVPPIITPVNGRFNPSLRSELNSAGFPGHDLILWNEDRVPGNRESGVERRRIICYIHLLDVTRRKKRHVQARNVHPKAKAPEKGGRVRPAPVPRKRGKPDELPGQHL